MQREEEIYEEFQDTGHEDHCAECRKDALGCAILRCDYCGERAADIYWTLYLRGNNVRDRCICYKCAGAVGDTWKNDHAEASGALLKGAKMKYQDGTSG